MIRTRVRRSVRPAPADGGAGASARCWRTSGSATTRPWGATSRGSGTTCRVEGRAASWSAPSRSSSDPGGKRLRPALTYFAYRAFGGRSHGRVLPLATSTELLHTYLLIHDDIMDRSELRRGEPTAHEKFRRRHSGRGLPGDAEHSGRSGGILAGDLAHPWAVELFHSIPTAENGRGRDLEEAFSAMCAEVVSGQYLEVVLPQGEYDDVSEDDLLEILRLESGRYSVERSVQLGSLLLGGGPEEAEVRVARAVVRRSDALARVEDTFRRRLDRAEAVVEEATVDEEARTFFTGLVHYLRGRER